MPTGTSSPSGGGAANRLGLALQLCVLRYLGFVPRNLSAAPRSAACFVADQLEVSPDEIQSYARRERLLDAPVTGTWKNSKLGRLERALEHEAPKVLFRLARERLRTERLVFPAPRPNRTTCQFGARSRTGENVHPGRALAERREASPARRSARGQGLERHCQRKVARTEFSTDDRELGRPELTPLGECGGAVELEIVS